MRGSVRDGERMGCPAGLLCSVSFIPEHHAMSNYWVLAADASKARLFTREKKYGPLTERKDWQHPASRVSGHDLETDRPGQSFSSQGGGQNVLDHGTEPKAQEAERFATELADMLDTARARGDFEHLQIAADPKFLGLLRARLDDDTRALIHREVDKNLTDQSSDDIAKALDASD
jgi:protein required for attachment to host cells